MKSVAFRNRDLKLESDQIATMPFQRKHVPIIIMTKHKFREDDLVVVSFPRIHISNQLLIIHARQAAHEHQPGIKATIICSGIEDLMTIASQEVMSRNASEESWYKDLLHDK